MSHYQDLIDSLLIELGQQKDRAQRAENDADRYRTAFHWLTTKPWYLKHHPELIEYLNRNPALYPPLIDKTP